MECAVGWFGAIALFVMYMLERGKRSTVEARVWFALTAQRELGWDAEKTIGEIRQAMARPL